MASRDLVNNLAVVQLLAPGQQAASPLTNFTSSILDTQGFESAMLLLDVGTLTGFTAGNFLTLTLQESNGTVGAGFTNVATTANSLAGTPSATADFGDQDRPFGTSLSGPGGTSGSTVTPVPALLPAPGIIPNLYSGYLPLNSTSQANAHYRLGYIGSMRYIRLLGTWTGSPSVAYIGVLGILGHALYLPIQASPAAIIAS